MVAAALAALLAAAAAASADTSAAAGTCKPVRTMAPFNVSEFVAHRWYVQAQQPIIYLPKAESYCVTASYTQTSATSIDVDNVSLSLHYTLATSVAQPVQARSLRPGAAIPLRVRNPPPRCRV